MRLSKTHRDLYHEREKLIGCIANEDVTNVFAAPTCHDRVQFVKGVKRGPDQRAFNGAFEV
jgi:hypothetical protein